MMGVDEEGTHAALKALRRELADPKIKEHPTGDGLLIEFASVVDAVRRAVDVQREMAERNAAVPSDRPIEFRMGITRPRSCRHLRIAGRDHRGGDDRRCSCRCRSRATRPRAVIRQVPGEWHPHMPQRLDALTIGARLAVADA